MKDTIIKEIMKYALKPETEVFLSDKYDLVLTDLDSKIQLGIVTIYSGDIFISGFTKTGMKQLKADVRLIIKYKELFEGHPYQDILEIVRADKRVKREQNAKLKAIQLELQKQEEYKRNIAINRLNTLESIFNGYYIFKSDRDNDTYTKVNRIAHKDKNEQVFKDTEEHSKIKELFELRHKLSKGEL